MTNDVRQRREGAFLSQRDLAARSGVSRTTIAKMECGGTVTSMKWRKVESVLRGDAMTKDEQPVSGYEPSQTVNLAQRQQDFEMAERRANMAVKAVKWGALRKSEAAPFILAFLNSDEAAL